MENTNFKKKWILRGLFWGVFMFITLAIAMPLAEGVKLTASGLIIKLAIWLFMGFVYGFILHQIERPKKD